MPGQNVSWWDYNSDQPYPLAGSDKPRTRGPQLREYLSVLGTAVLLFPSVMWRYATHRPAPARPDPKTFIGLGVSPDLRYNDAVADMVAELEVEELLVRVPTWSLEDLDAIASFMARFPRQRFLVNVLQDRAAVNDPQLWRRRLHSVFDALGGRAEYFQIGNAINRTKWGCSHSGEYLALLETAQSLRAEFPRIKFVGSSVIDFDPLVSLRTLYNRRSYHLDVASALLYVNRRGSPYTRQFLIFNLASKLRLLHSIVDAGNRNERRLWVTEFNWPLLNTKPYTPNSGNPRSTVDEPTQAKYLRQYYDIAYASGCVEKVYWWQLIAPGYGLVDHRGGKLRRHPSFTAFKEILHGGI